MAIAKHISGATVASDDELYWSDEENGWVVGRPSRFRSINSGKKRVVPDGLPHRMYERRGKRIVTWWMKDPDNRTRVIHRVPASSSEGELNQAREYAIQRADGPNGRVNRAPFRSGENWAANYGRSGPKGFCSPQRVASVGSGGFQERSQGRRSEEHRLDAD